MATKYRGPIPEPPKTPHMFDSAYLLQVVAIHRAAGARGTAFGWLHEAREWRLAQVRAGFRLP